MFRRFFVWHAALIASMAVFIGSSMADEAVKGDATERALLQFHYQGISFATSIAEFSRRFPQQLKNSKPADEKLGLKSIVATTAEGDGIEVEFFNGKAYKIDLIYTAARINEMGGIEVFTRKIVERLGAFDDTVSAPGTGYRNIWNRANVNRRAELSVISSAVMVSVIDTSIEAAVKDQRAKSLDLGF
jgi:hypothetical protein